MSDLELAVLRSVWRRQRRFACVHWRDVYDDVRELSGEDSDEVWGAIEQLTFKHLLRMDAFASRPADEGRTDSGLYVPDDVRGLVAQLVGALTGGARSRLSTLAA